MQQMRRRDQKRVKTAKYNKKLGTALNEKPFNLVTMIKTGKNSVLTTGLDVKTMP